MATQIHGFGPQGEVSPGAAEGIQDVVGAMIVAAGGTYDDEAGTITLPSGAVVDPEDVEQIVAAYLVENPPSGGTGTVDVNLEDEDTGYPARSAAPLVIWRGWTDPTADPSFVANVDLWAQADPPFVPVTSWFTDFSTDTPGLPPAGWTPTWAALSSYNVVNQSGNHVLQPRKTAGGATVGLLRWDTPTPADDMEVVAKVRFTTSIVSATTYQMHSVAVRCSGATEGTDAKGYTGLFYSDPTAPKLRVGKRFPAANNILPVTGAPNAPGYADQDWNWIRLRAEGSAISIRSWADGDTEPSTWTWAGVDTSITTGAPGLAFYSTGLNNYDVDCIGVAIGGATAPTSAT